MGQNMKRKGESGQRQLPEVFCKKDVLKNFATFTGVLPLNLRSF